MSILDSIFNKHFGPVFLKEKSDAEEFIEKMKALSANASGDLKNEIEEQIAAAEAGLYGERQIVFELKNSGLDMYVLHDIYLEKNGLSAQIDFLVMTRQHIFVIECKNLYGDIEIDGKGNFIRHMSFGKRYKKEGIYSPVTQNERHLNVLKEVRFEAKTNILTQMIFESTFSQNYLSMVVLANPKTVLNDKNAPADVKSKVMRADQIVAYIKAADAKNEDANWTESDIRETVQYFLDKSLPNKSDYAKKYEELLAAQCAQESKKGEAPASASTEESGKICPKCGKPMVLRTAKKGENVGQQFWGCSGFPKCWYKDT